MLRRGRLLVLLDVIERKVEVRDDFLEVSSIRLIVVTISIFRQRPAAKDEFLARVHDLLRRRDIAPQQSFLLPLLES